MIPIVHVITELETGGAEHALVQLVSRMDRRRFAPTVISLSGAGTLGARLKASGIPGVEIGMKPGRLNLKRLWRLRGAIAARRPAIVQTWLPHADLLGTIAGRAAGVRTICWNVRCAELERADHPRSLFVVLKVLASISRQTACVVANAHSAVRAHSALGYMPKQWRVIPNGFDTDIFVPSPEHRRQFRQAHAIPADAPVIGIVGRFHPMKDHATFIRAAGLLRRHVPHIRIVLVGHGIGTDNLSIMNELRDAGVADAAVLLPSTSTPQFIYPALDLAVSSSYSEGFPNVVAEAMSSGVVPIVTDAGDSARIVGDAGIVVPPRRPDAIADAAMKLLAAAPADREALGAAARAQIRDNFSLASMVQHYEELYAELTGASRGATVVLPCVG